MNKITRKNPNYRTIQYIGYIQNVKCIGYYEKAFNLGRNIIKAYLYNMHKRS